MIENTFFDGMTIEAYHSGKGESRSLILEALRSAAHYASARETPRGDPTPAMIVGAATHTAVLEPDRFGARYEIEPDDHARRNSNAYKAWAGAVDPTKEILKPEEGGLVRRMAQEIRSKPVASRLLDGGIPERSYYWTDPKTGLLCRCRPDWLREDDRVIVDLKTAKDASFRGFKRATEEHKYHMQAAFYLDGIKAVTGHEHSWVFLVVEKSDPFAVAYYSLSKMDIEDGRALYRHGLSIIAEARKTGLWDGYPQEVQELVLSPWASQI